MTREEALTNLNDIIDTLGRHGVPRRVAVKVIHTVVQIVAGRVTALFQAIDKEMENQWP